MKKTIVSAKYKNGAGEYGGRAYTYYCTVPVAVGDIVIAPTTTGERKAMIAEINIPVDNIEKSVLSKLKTIVSLAGKGEMEKGQPPKRVVIGEGGSLSDAEPGDVVVFGGDAISGADEQLIIIKTMPVIEQQLEALKPEIEAMTAEALAMECTKENIRIVKKVCSDLNKKAEVLDQRRIQIKTQYMAAYDAMNQTFKTCVTDPINKAVRELRGKINELETADKKKTEDAIRLYFSEYAESVGYPGIPYDRAGINITLTATEKSLKDKARAFIDRVSADLGVIDGLKNADEITVEYNASLNLKTAIDTVKERHRQIEAANRQREEAAAAEAQRIAAAARIAEAQAQQRKEKMLAAVENRPVVLSAPVVEKPPIVEAPPVVEKAPDKDPNEIVRVSFTVTTARRKIRLLREFMIKEGIEYGR